MNIWENDEFSVNVEGTNDVISHEVYMKIVRWFIQHEAFCGEVIMQDDGCMMDAPMLLAELADKVFKFNVTYKENTDE